MYEHGWYGVYSISCLTDEQEEDQQAKFSHGRLERPAKNLQSLRVAGQFEDPEHPHETDYPQNSQAHGLVGGLILRRYGSSRQVQSVLLLGNDGRQGDEVRDNGDYINDVHDVSEEVEFVGTRQEPHDQFEGEPDDAECFNKEEWIGDIRDLVLLDLRAVGGGIEDFVVFEFRKGLQAEDDDGEEDDEDRDDGNDARGLGALGVFEEQPDFALAFVGGKGLLFLLDETFILTVR